MKVHDADPTAGMRVPVIVGQSLVKAVLPNALVPRQVATPAPRVGELVAPVLRGRDRGGDSGGQRHSV